jgi:uncharacterized protein (DUF342 family)
MLEKIALQKNLITKEQCVAALNACKGAKNMEMALKDYFISKGLIPIQQMKQVVSTFQAVKVMRKNAVFGTIAVKLGFIDNTLFQKEMARQKQAAGKKAAPRFIGELWVKNKTISKDQFIKILRIQEKRPAAPQRPAKNASSEPQAKKGSADGQIPAAPVPPPDEPAAEAPDYSLVKELSGGVILEIDDQGMNAFIKKTDKFDDTISPAELLELITENDIFYGVVKEKALEGFIRSSGFKEKPFKVAGGREAQLGKDSRIEYYFDTDHLKAGGFDEEGNIDFKDRGEIPWVEEGSLLAEKFPMKEARSGYNIFDQMLEVPPVSDTPLRYKSGVVLSDDDLKLYAETGGHPRLSWSGNVQVVDTFVVKKDVDYETGHLEYSGDIDVKGTLKSGFRVRGHGIRINTADGGEIHAEGDVTIVNGVNEARIYARGNVKAKFIQNSKVFCLGNLTVDKEIVDTKIEASGAVIIPNGEIISSDIVANMGVYTRHLGTEKSVPNTVTVGVDAFTDQELKTIRKTITRSELRIEQIKEKIQALTKDIKGLHQATNRLAHELDMARDEGLTLSRKAEGEKPPAGLKSQIQSNKALFSRLDKDLNRYFDRIEKNENRILEMRMEHEQLEDELDDLQYELANFTDWMETNPGLAVVTVTGRVTPGTTVKGPNASREITDKLANVKIKEILSSKQGDEGYKVQIHENIKR